MTDRPFADEEVEVGTKSAPPPGWSFDEPVVVPEEFLPPRDDEDRADPQMEP